MPAELKFIIFWAVIIIPFIAGAIVNKRLHDPQRMAKKLINTNLFLLEPLILLWTIWGLKLDSQLIILPAAGLLTVFAGLFLGRLFVQVLKLHNAGRSSYLISSCLSNQGMTMGGLLCFMIAGEKGLALASIYTVYYLPFVFMVIFPYARVSASKFSGKEFAGPVISAGQFFSFFFNLQNLPLAGVIIAVLLQVCGINRPVIYFPLELILGAAISIYYFTLGINFKTGDVTSYIPELATISLSKFFIIPLITYVSLYFTNIDMNIKTVIILQSFAPAAIYSVISSILFDLDSRMSSGIFVSNSLVFLAVVMPFLVIFSRALIN